MSDYLRWVLGRAVMLVALLPLLLAACTSDAKNTEELPEVINPATVTPGQKVNVVATTTHATDFVRVVGGDRVALTGLVKPGVDLHEFSPVPQEIQRITEAHLIVINGLGLEPFMEKVLQQAGGNKPVAVLARGVAIRKGDESEFKAGDPHIWYNPRNVKVMVQNLANALARVDPAGEAEYRANAAAYSRELDALDARLEGLVNTIPLERRKLVTNHDAYGYYAERYGLTVVGSVIPSLETNAAPSAKQTADLVRAIQREGVPAIFTEAAVSAALEEQIARDAGVKVVATLCADSLTDASGPCPTYLALMEHDTRAIVDGLR